MEKDRGLWKPFRKHCAFSCAHTQEEVASMPATALSTGELLPGSTKGEGILWADNVCLGLLGGFVLESWVWLKGYNWTGGGGNGVRLTDLLEEQGRSCMDSCSHMSLLLPAASSTLALSWHIDCHLHTPWAICTHIYQSEFSLYINSKTFLLISCWFLEIDF